GASGSVDGNGSNARFNNPDAVALDVAGNLYVAEFLGQTIRKITPAGIVDTLAGLASTSGTNDGTGRNARFFAPNGVAVDASGNVYVADSDNRTVRKGVPDVGQPIITLQPQSQTVAAGG